MKKTRKMSVCLFGFALLLATGCYKDKGNYDYTELNDFKIEDFKNEYEIAQGDVLEIIPSVEEKANTTGRFSYAWTIEGRSDGTMEQSQVDTLGKDKALKKTIHLKPGEYTLQYTVKEKATGIFAAKQAKLAVKAAYQEGWLVLEETANGGDIALINNRTDRVYRNLFSNGNEGRRIPLPLYNIFQPSLQWETKPVFVVAKGYNKTLDQYTFREDKETKQLFAVPQIDDQQMTYLDSRSGILNRFSPPAIFNGRYSHIENPNVVRGILFNEPAPGEYELEPFIGSVGYVTFGFDRQNKRFVYFFDGRTFMYTHFPIGSFDPTDIPYHMLYGMTIGKRLYTGLFEDKANLGKTYYIYQLTTENLYDVSALNKYTIDASNLPGLERANLFTGSTRTQSLYYATSNQVYRFDVLGQAARSIHSFPAGEQVTTIEYANGQMVVSTWNGTEGRVYFFEMNDFETFSSQPLKTYGGFGKIAALKQKFG